MHEQLPFPIEGFDALAVAASDPWWTDCAERALTWWAETGVEFDCFDLTELGVPDPDHPNRWGALFASARARRLIEPVGYRPSRRRSRHGGVCRVWRGSERLGKAA